MLLERFDQQAVLLEPDEPDAYYELIEVFDAALSDEAIERFDIWLLHELATVASAEATPLRRGRCGWTVPAVVETVAARRPEAARTLRQRVGKALDALDVSTRTVRLYIAEGQLDAVRLGRKTLRIKVDSIERFIDARPVGNWR